MRRRGFTMLEVTLAMFIASMMVLACLALFASLNRHERLLSTRFADTSAFERTHRVVQRSMELLLMAQVAEPKTPRTTPTARPEIVEEEPESPRDARDPREPERFILEPDPSPGVALMPPPDVAGPQVAGGGDAPGAQRLEVALIRHPVTPAARGRTGRAIMGTRQAQRESRRTPQRPERREPPEGEEEDLEIDPDADVQAVRGAFEIRPTIPRGRDDPGGYSLWWQPLERSPNAEEPPKPAALAPVELVRGLRWARWAVFQAKEWRERYHTSYVENLPAYVSFRARTMSGYYVDWLFEIKWDWGPEFIEEEEERSPGDGSGEDAGRDGTAGGAAGGLTEDGGTTSGGGRSTTGGGR